MTDQGLMSSPGAGPRNQSAAKIDPSRAAATAARWRRSVAEALGEDPGASLDRPDRKLLMLRVFGATRRLADLCLTFPVAAATALQDGPSPVIAEAARDLAGLDKGVGGPDALHAALLPLKSRIDIAIGLAELSGEWSAHEATAARTDFAERLTETALGWLVRSAVKRGELSVKDKDAPTQGVFALAGGDFAHEDLAPNGALEAIVIYDEEAFQGPTPKSAERVFVRIGAEFRETFEGRPGEFPLFALKTPLGSKIGGAGLTESIKRLAGTLAGPQSDALRAWVAGSRVVAGDRSLGGAFLEDTEEIVWGDTALLTSELKAKLTAKSEDPRSAFRAVADLCRLTIGRTRPVFRTASAHHIFEIAADGRSIAPDVARRLVAGDEFAQSLVSAAQMLKGACTFSVGEQTQQEALAVLCGYDAYDALMLTLGGLQADARNTLDHLLNGPQQEFTRYRITHEAEPSSTDDVGKLEDLGFLDGEGVASAADKWALITGEDADGIRISAKAPGLLSAFGETQHPNDAVRLFDQLIKVAPNSADVLVSVAEDGKPRSAIVDGLGCFGPAVASLLKTPETAAALLEDRGAETPSNGDEWLSRFPAPKLTDGGKTEDLAAWRRASIGRIALFLAGEAMDFDAASNILEAVHLKTLESLFEINLAANKALDPNDLSLHVLRGSGRFAPGDETIIGFAASENASAEHIDKAARSYISTLDTLGEGVFAIAPDISRRPEGVAGPVAPTIATLASYVQSEAIAFDQILLSRARVIAGGEKIGTAAGEALRGAVTSSRRADVLFRDLDRARAQRLRRDKTNSQWDIDRSEGGRADTELVISTLIYRHAAAHPFLQDREPEEALEAMANSGLIDPETANALTSARLFWGRIAIAKALARWADPTTAPVRNRYGAILARAAGVSKFEQVRPLMRGYTEDVTRAYATYVLGRPNLSVVSA